MCLPEEPIMRIKVGYFFFALSILAAPGDSNASSHFMPQSMGAVGDSITAASIAKYSRDSAASWLEFVEDTNAGKPLRFPFLSWSTGSDPRVGSLVLRLMDLFQLFAPPVGNFAVPGAI